MKKLIGRLGRRTSSVERFFSSVALAVSLLGFFVTQNLLIYGILAVTVFFIGYLLFTSVKVEPVPQLEPKTERQLKLHIPPSNQELEQAIEIASDFFAPHAIDPAHVRKIYEVSSDSFMTVFDSRRGRVIAYADIYTSETENFKRFLAGEISEEGLSSEDFAQRGVNCSKFYIGAIAVEERGQAVRGKCAEALIYALIDFILKHSNSEYIDVYSIGFTKEGRALLERLGFASQGIRKSRDGEGFHRRVSRKYLIRSKKDYAMSHYYIDYMYE